MEKQYKKILSGTFLTRKPRFDGTFVTFLCTLILLGTSFIYLQGLLIDPKLLVGEHAAVFRHHEYWRAWSALFAHADLKHIGSNLVLFVPFSYYLSSYYGSVFFPLVGFLVGGLTNFCVLALMPEGTALLGVSGVVHWMGGAWMALLFMIDRRDVGLKRLFKVVAVSVMLFIPDIYDPTVSHKSHAFGFFFGVLSGLIYYHVKESTFRAADRFAYKDVSIPEWYLQIEEETVRSEPQIPVLTSSDAREP